MIYVCSDGAKRNLDDEKELEVRVIPELFCRET